MFIILKYFYAALPTGSAALIFPHKSTSLVMIAEQYPGLLERSDGEKLQLAGELWRDVIGDEIASDDPSLVTLLESRLEEYHAHPERVSTWDEVKARLLALRP